MSKLDIIRARAKKLGLKGEIYPSKRIDKKYAYINPSGKVVNFGQIGYEDYLDHRDKVRRANYRKRASGLILKSGKRAIDVKGSAAYLSYHLLW